MISETPAEGILRRHTWGNCKTYQVVCSCGQPDHDHDVWIEADEAGVTIQTFITVKSDCWSETIKPRYDIDSIWLQEVDWAVKSIINGFINRVKLTWELWTKGYIKTESSLTMSEQQALNYADTLKSAINDVKEFRNTK